MTPAERNQIIATRGDIAELALRLFGDDGNGGALGSLAEKVDGIDSRIRALEADKIARDAVSGERRRRSDSARLSREARLALGVTIVLGLLGALSQASGWLGLIH